MSHHSMKRILNPVLFGRIMVSFLVLGLIMSHGLALGQQASSGKRRIAVMDFLDQTSYPQWNVGRGMRVEFETRLVKTGQFEVIERERLETIMAEQGLGATGMIDPSTAAQIGKLLGVEAMVMGSVTQFTVKTDRVTLPFLGRVQASEAQVTIHVRVVDTNTGSITLAESAEGKESQANIALNIEGMPPMAFGSSGFHNTILGKATSKAVDQLISKIMQLYPMQGYVVAIMGDKVYTNLGRPSGVQPGMKLKVYKEGQVIKDPFTGAVLSSVKEDIAVLKVVSAEEKVSICTVEAPGSIAKISVGDKVMIQY